MEGSTGGDTNHVRGLVASQKVFHIIQIHNKEKEPIMVGKDLVFIEKEAT